MKVHTATRGSVLALLFVACGHLDLGDYGELEPAPSGIPVIPPAPPAMGGNTSGSAAGNDAGPEGHDAGRGGDDAGQDPVGGVGGAGGARGIDGEAGRAEGGETGVGGDHSSLERVKNSCRSSPAICGMDYRSCCSVDYVDGGEFMRRGAIPQNSTSVLSHVSGFYLGTFEVTVGRFQAFLADYDAWRATGAPHLGAGRHPRIPGSGWRAEWSRRPGDPPEDYGLGVDRAEVEREVSGCMGIPFSTAMWLQPVNCVSFYEAQAFCIWDGGRLPTDLEWEYAAAGGNDHRLYPWGTEPPDQQRARFGCIATPGSPCLIPPVGTYPTGVGRFGQFDLAGSLAEWTFDTVAQPLPVPCNDCAIVDEIHAANPRDIRGGSWNSGGEQLMTSWNSFIDARVHLPMHGFRCAYDASEVPSP